MFSTLLLEYGAERATVTLNRPDKRNAITPAMIAELQTALDEIEKKKVRVVIVTGAGPAFCAGMDLDMLQAISKQSPQENQEDSKRMAKLFRRIWSFPRPLIAAVNGHALAGGCGIATLCDFTLAVPEACFGYTEVRIGFVPAIVSSFLIRQVGEKIARDLLLTGRLFDAEEAFRIGLVKEIVPADKLMTRTHALASEVLENSPASLRATKRLLTDSARSELDSQIEAAVRDNAAIRETADFREGVTSFLEKRKPKWSSQ